MVDRRCFKGRTQAHYSCVCKQ